MTAQKGTRNPASNLQTGLYRFAFFHLGLSA